MRAETNTSLQVAAISAAGGALWIAGGMLGGATSRWQPAANALVIAALLLLPLALLGLTARLQRRHGTAARWVHSLAWAGAGLAASSRALHLAMGNTGAGTLATTVFGVGIFLLCAALIVLGGGALQSATEPGWDALPLLVGLTGLFLPVGAGVAGAAGLVAWAIWGAGWIWIGYVLWQERTTTWTRARAKSIHSWRDTARGD